MNINLNDDEIKGMSKHKFKKYLKQKINTANYLSIYIWKHD